MQFKTHNDFEKFTYYRLGPDFDVSGVPTFLYFSISGSESLTLDPYNQIAVLLAHQGYRVLSVTLPGHQEGQDKHQAMQYWSDHLEELSSFIDKAHLFVDYLFENKNLNDEQFAIGGLSRGGFITLHLLSHPKVKYGVGIAPLTHLNNLEEFKSDRPLPKELQIELLFEKMYSKSLFFVIGNRDERVSTDAAFKLLRDLSEYAYSKRVRSPKFEMRLFPSVGLKGHGSLPHVFEEAAQWVQKQFER